MQSRQRSARDSPLRQAVVDSRDHDRNVPPRSGCSRNAMARSGEVCPPAHPPTKQCRPATRRPAAIGHSAARPASVWLRQYARRDDAPAAPRRQAKVMRQRWRRPAAQLCRQWRGVRLSCEKAESSARCPQLTLEELDHLAQRPLIAELAIAMAGANQFEQLAAACFHEGRVQQLALRSRHHRVAVAVHDQERRIVRRAYVIGFAAFATSAA